MENPEKATCFNEVESLVIKFTDEVARNVKGSHATVAQLKKAYGATEIVELVMSIGFWGMVARLLETTEVDLEDFAGKVNLLESRLRPPHLKSSQPGVFRPRNLVGIGSPQEKRNRSSARSP